MSEYLRISITNQISDSFNAAIARATYERWGISGLVHLIGDWSVVIRDHVNRTTVLASDFAGMRPLYYHVQSGGVFNAPWQEALRPVARALLKTKQLRIVEQGFAERTSVRARLERLSVGLECNQSQLRQIILLELWLRNRADEGLSGRMLQAA